MLNREIDDLMQWIAEREVVAGSHELGQDFEHVTVSVVRLLDRNILAFPSYYCSLVSYQMLLDRFKDFARDTKMIGEERVARANEICDQLIGGGHSDAATIAEWKVASSPSRETLAAAQSVLSMCRYLSAVVGRPERCLG